jgi:hypothetical protein
MTRETFYLRMYALGCACVGALFINSERLSPISGGLMINQGHVAHEGLGVLRWLALAAAVVLPFLLMYMTQIG